MNNIGIFPGSFDPITKGHEHIIIKAAKMVDQLVVAIGTNSTKNYLFDIEKRIEWVEATFKNHDNIIVKTYAGLTVEFANTIKAKYIFRGLRSSIDFEYEKSIAETNKLLSPNIESIFLLPDSSISMISSSIIREIIKNNGNVEQFLPEQVKIY
jgi:pantetheine-phosphate adenylyltransferase